MHIYKHIGYLFASAYIPLWQTFATYLYSCVSILLSRHSDKIGTDGQAYIYFSRMPFANPAKPQKANTVAMAR